MVQVPKGMDTKKGLNYAVDGLEMGFPEATQVCQNHLHPRGSRSVALRARTHAQMPAPLARPLEQTRAITSAPTETEVRALT